ncbi:MAG: NapC/NirT family cytochrome c [Gammaproteobacteria bacterium]|nr:NapC/NirT family cytochrome c [Gammaproteobacteria bacterium]MCW9056544.1 NapC/NirT family cytochrome c [Gammaproteobacteria bacterium]
MFELYGHLLSRKIILGTTLGAGLFFMVVGVIFWGGFNTAMEATNTLEFCISCHEMEENVYQEYTKTIHYTNRAGVRATCSDCHVPDPWVHKVVRKIQASNEVLHKLLGTIDTPEKFNEKRLTLAKNVWRTMKETDSRECRNCHDFTTMNPKNQKARARKQHLNAMKAGNTCIDCHKGIAHSKIHDKLTEEELEAMEQPNPDHIHDIAPQWSAFEEGKTEATEMTTAPAETANLPAPVTAETAAPVAAAPAASSGSGDWSGVAARTVTVFYPGQSSMEWILGRDHSGKRAFNSGDRCFDCHEEELVDLGNKIITGGKTAKVGNEQENMEPTLIPGKRGSFPVQVQASHDNENMYLRFSWADSEHTPAPFVEGGKMDPANKVKLAIMFATDDVEYADRAGCWGTCHADLRSMPFAPDQATIAGSPAASLNSADGITKYIGESRSEINLKTRKGALGGWDKLKDAGEIKAELDAGHYMDIIRYKAGDKTTENGHVFADRTLNDGMGVEFTAALNNGTWTVEVTRKLASDKPGDISFDMGTVYNFGFAIHDDYTTARYHHVSLGYKLGFDNEEAEINVIKK